ncbi:MAG TPA: serine/threonine-protein kinase [Rhodothermales bacterium]|nr:serine/threonine-protein kinase [Rhodothermales bacterium]
MTTDWDRIEALFDAAMEQPDAHRADWVVASCDDPEIRKEVLDLIDADARAGQFLETPAGLYAADLIRSEEIDQVGRLGPYRIVREVGRGGMGAVYLAERVDGQFDHQVAVKMLRPHVANDSLARRFLAERQILAGLHHPNIARLLDGGVSESGTPYFVMDFIDGIPIDTYCDENALSIDERLRLFLTVCEAVSYAHHQLIVHRDLKPSNILVTGDGAVKLLDFGIAKLLQTEDSTTSAVETGTGQFLLTPEYASPEQVLGHPISIASDVYQLGLLLYRLLTGILPHRFSNRSLTDIARVVSEVEPSRPSASIDSGSVWTEEYGREKLAKRIRGDLDAIILKALRKEPGGRYESVDRLAQDVRHHMDGRPVTAHTGSVIYRVRKFARRNRWQVAAGFLFVMLLAGYAATVTIQQQRTARERDRAKEYATFLTDLFSSPDPFDASSPADARDVTVREFMDTGVERLRSRFAGDDELRISLFETIAKVYESLGYPEKARDLYEEMVTFAMDRHGERSAATIEALQFLVGVTTDSTAADSLFDTQLDLAREFEGETGPLTARSLTLYGRWLAENGKFDAGVAALDEAVTTLRRAGPEHAEALIGALLFSSRVHGTLNRIGAADSLITEAYALRSSVSGDDHPSTAMIVSQLAIVAETKGDLEAAERLKREVLRIFGESLGDHHSYTLGAAANLSVLLGKTGRYHEAEEMAWEILSTREAYLGPQHPETIGALQNTATYILRQGRLEEALPLFLDAHARYKAALSPDHPIIAYPLLSLTDLYLQLGDVKAAESYAREASAHLGRVLPEGHPIAAVAASRLGETLMKQSMFDEAEPLLVTSFEHLRDSQGYEVYQERARERVTSLYTVMDRPEDAERYRSMPSEDGR